MNQKLIPINIHKVMQATNYTIFVLEGEGKLFSIYTAPWAGDLIQNHLAKMQPVRPQTPDLMNSMMQSLDISPLQVVIHDLQENIYFCRLFLEQVTQETQILEIDARPSDCLCLAIKHNVPVYCTKELLDKTVEYTA